MSRGDGEDFGFGGLDPLSPEMLGPLIESLEGKFGEIEAEITIQETEDWRQEELCTF